MSRRTLLTLPAALGALAFLSACADPVTAPVTPDTEVYADQILPAAFPDTTDFRNMAGEVWVCATGNAPGNDFHYAYSVRDNVTGAVLAKGMLHNVSIGQCVLLATVPTDVRGHYTARVKQDAPGVFYMAHGFFNFGFGFPATPPPSTVDLRTRTMVSGLSSDAGVVMNFYNLLN